MQIKGPVGLVTMQKDGDRRDSDVGQAQRHQRITPPWEIEQAKLHHRFLRRIETRKGHVR
ncbi:hypothetical protein CS8_009820 [Cupriavidus sp. 8B]